LPNGDASFLFAKQHELEKSFNKILPSMNIMQTGGNTTIIAKITKTLI
jgi:hypothetical protein